MSSGTMFELVVGLAGFQRVDFLSMEYVTEIDIQAPIDILLYVYICRLATTLTDVILARDLHWTTEFGGVHLIETRFYRTANDSRD